MAKKARKFNVEAYPYPQCREQHYWQPFDGGIDQKAKLAHRVQKCANCPTRKHSVISLHPGDYGQLAKPSRYSYPTDYRVEGGMGRDIKGSIRAYNFLAELEQLKEQKDT